MPRVARMVVGGERISYHIISLTALDGVPFGDVDKDELVIITNGGGGILWTPTSHE